MDATYDRSADIAWFRASRFAGAHVHSEESDSGLVDRDERTGEVVGVEFWHASERLPAELLELLPAPGPEPVSSR